MADKFSVPNDILAVVADIYPDLSPTKAVVYLNIVRARILTLLQIHRTSETISLVAGQSQYLYSALAEKVDMVEYRRSATQADFKPLLPTDITQLEAEETRFRGYTNGEPARFYLTADSTGPLIGLVPAPSLTTSAGYPILTVYENTTSALASNSTFNDDLPTVEVYTRGIARQWAEKNDMANFQMRDALYQVSLNECIAYLKNKNKNYQTRLKPSWMKSRGVI